MAYFRTRIGLRNALQEEISGSSDKEAVLITLNRPIVFAQPVAFDRGLFFPFFFLLTTACIKYKNSSSSVNYDLLGLPGSKHPVTVMKSGIDVTFFAPIYPPAPFCPTAVLFWLNYKAAYDNWNEQRMALNKDIHMATKEVVDKLPGIQQTSVQAFSTLFLQLTVNDLGICLPITNASQVNRWAPFRRFKVSIVEQCFFVLYFHCAHPQPR